MYRVYGARSICLYLNWHVMGDVFMIILVTISSLVPNFRQGWPGIPDPVFMITLVTITSQDWPGILDQVFKSALKGKWIHDCWHSRWVCWQLYYHKFLTVAVSWWIYFGGDWNTYWYALSAMMIISNSLIWTELWSYRMPSFHYNHHLFRKTLVPFSEPWVNFWVLWGEKNPVINWLTGMAFFFN